MPKAMMNLIRYAIVALMITPTLGVAQDYEVGLNSEKAGDVPCI